MTFPSAPASPNVTDSDTSFWEVVEGDLPDLPPLCGQDDISSLVQEIAFGVTPGKSTCYAPTLPDLLSDSYPPFTASDELSQFEQPVSKALTPEKKRRAPLSAVRKMRAVASRLERRATELENGARCFKGKEAEILERTAEMLETEAKWLERSAWRYDNGAKRFENAVIHRESAAVYRKRAIELCERGDEASWETSTVLNNLKKALNIRKAAIIKRKNAEKTPS